MKRHPLEENRMKFSIANQDRTIFLIYLVLIALPTVTVIGLPLPVSDSTRSFHKTLNSVPQNGKVLWLTEIAFALYTEIGGGEIAIYKELFKLMREKNVRVVFASTAAAEDVQVSRMIMTNYMTDQDRAGLKYGVNWVELGWLPGWESSVRGLVEDLHKVAKADFFGTPIEQIPMLKDIRSGKDFDLLGTGGYYVDEYARQWQGLGKTVLVNLSATNVALAKPWFEKGLLAGYLNGARGSAEFEAITGHKGAATKAMDSQSLAHLYAILLLVVPSLYHFAKGKGGSAK
jgi:hypothetical protein